MGVDVGKVPGQMEGAARQHNHDNPVSSNHQALSQW